MSGRPVQPPAPTHTVRTWATDTNYPAGTDDWSGQPTKVEPPGPTEGFVPGQGGDAEFFNKLFSDAFGTDQSAKDFLTSFASNAGSWASYLGQSPALNWKAATSIITGSVRVKFHAPTRNWCVGGSALIGAATQFGATTDLFTWPSANDIGGGSVVVSYSGAFDVDAGASIVMPGSGATDGTKIVERTTGTWTKRTVFTNAMVGTDVAYAPTANLWCVAGKRNGTDQIDVWTSPDRVNWTARTAPSMPFSAGVGPYCTLASDGAGVLVMQAFKDSTGGASTSFSRSTDGGITWSTPDTHTYTSDNPRFPRPVWTGTKWVAIAFNQTAHTCRVYNSADGSAFTQVASLSSAIQYIAVIGELLAGILDNGELVFSTDSGATWQFSDVKFVAGGSTVLTGGGIAGRFIAIDPGAGTVLVSDAASSGVKALT